MKNQFKITDHKQFNLNQILFPLSHRMTDYTINILNFRYKYFKLYNIFL
jgi:hypothetical protein